MLKVIQFSAGAPDKACKFTSGEYKLIQKDRVNLCDYTPEEIANMSEDTYCACMNDADIKYASKLPSEVKDKVGRRLMLPYGPEGLFDYERFYPKDSEFYKGLTKATGIRYTLAGSYTPDDFVLMAPELVNKDKFVVKVQEGSGSRGVYVINSERTPQAGSREQYLHWEYWMINDVVKWANKMNSKILVQELAYTDLSTQKKYNCNVIVRNGKLVLYKWNEPDNDSTNYDHADFIRNEFTDTFVNKLVNYITSFGITDIIFGVDGYTDYKDYVSAIEVNWRYENSFFEFEAFGIDFMDAYFHPDKYSMEMIPFGRHPFIRYWRCSMFNLTTGGPLNE